jgi:hypothetical protein
VGYPRVEKNTRPVPILIQVGYVYHPRVKNRLRTGSGTRWVPSTRTQIAIPNRHRLMHRDGPQEEVALVEEILLDRGTTPSASAPPSTNISLK